MPQDVLVYRKGALQLGQSLILSLEQGVDVKPLILLFQGVGQISGAPSILPEHLSAVGVDDTVVFFYHPVQRGPFHCRIYYVNSLVLPQFSPPLWLYLFIAFSTPSLMANSAAWADISIISFTLFFSDLSNGSRTYSSAG